MKELQLGKGWINQEMEKFISIMKKKNIYIKDNERTEGN